MADQHRSERPAALDGEGDCRGSFIASRRDAESFPSDTQLLHGGVARGPHADVSDPIHLTSAYVYASAEAAEAAGLCDGPDLVYARFRNPTVSAFETRLSLVEGAEAAQAMASGMAAVTAAFLSQLRAGDRVVAPHAVFGACHWLLGTLLPRFGVEITRVDGARLEDWEKALARPARLVFLETPANPTLEVIDLQAVSTLAKAAGAVLVVDNALASPLVQRPLDHGADLVVYSTTKHIDGQGRCLGGAILGSAKLIQEQIVPFARSSGPTLSPFSAWIMLKGLETLGLRVRHAAATAHFLAEQLEGHPKLASLSYPGLESHPQRALVRRQMQGGGTLLALEIKGGKAGAFRFLNALKLVLRVNNLGDVRSLASHAGTTTHGKLTPEEKAAARIGEGLVRLSVGLEEKADLLKDITDAFDAV